MARSSSSTKARQREANKNPPTPLRKVVSPDKQTRHHRRPRSAGGGNEKRNISSVRHSDHVAYHKLFGPGLPGVVTSTLNEVWIDPDVVVVAMKKSDYKKYRAIMLKIKL